MVPTNNKMCESSSADLGSTNQQRPLFTEFSAEMGDRLILVQGDFEN